MFRRSLRRLEVDRSCASSTFRHVRLAALAIVVIAAWPMPCLAALYTVQNEYWQRSGSNTNTSTGQVTTFSNSGDSVPASGNPRGSLTDASIILYTSAHATAMMPFNSPYSDGASDSTSIEVEFWLSSPTLLTYNWTFEWNSFESFNYIGGVQLSGPNANEAVEEITVDDYEAVGAQIGMGTVLAEPGLWKLKLTSHASAYSFEANEVSSHRENGMTSLAFESVGVPEPASWVVMALGGLVSLVFVRVRRRPAHSE